MYLPLRVVLYQPDRLRIPFIRNANVDDSIIMSNRACVLVMCPMLPVVLVYLKVEC